MSKAVNMMNGYMRSQCKRINSQLIEESKPLKHKKSKKTDGVVKMKDVTNNEHKRRVIQKPEVSLKAFPVFYIGYWCMIIYYLTRLF
ncbi:hypothetical protein H9L25_00290 [Terrisporobacter mayombei]|nr:hypothetical protein [Terrisporobacter mayombei]